jgi:uncharacterized protein
MMRRMALSKVYGRKPGATLPLLAGILCLGAVLLGCSPKTPEATVEANGHARTNAPSGPTQAQAKLPTMKLFLGTNEISAELARTQSQWQTGMMYRKTIGESESMLFIFPMPHRASFYMKNTVVPLSCAYIDAEGVILEIHDLKPLDEQPVPAKTDRVQFVLETAQGWFERHHVSAGSALLTEHGGLMETFFTRR